MQRLQVDQNYSVLSDQCLMVRRELFSTVGGFDERLVPWADSDLCLKVQQAGYLNVWTPRVQLLISDFETPVPTPEQENALYERWLPQLGRDRAYNPNFSLSSGNAFHVADSSRTWHPLSACKLIPRVLAHPAESVNDSQRIVQPFAALRTGGLIEGLVSADLLSVVELQRYDPDVIVLQQVTTDGHLQAMRRMKAFSRAFKVFEPGESVPITEDRLAAMRQGLLCMDRLVVSTPAMAQVFDGFNADIRVINTRLNPAEWDGLVSERRRSEKPRVGWAGSLMDVDQLDMLANVVKDLVGDVHWVVFGPCPEPLRPFIHEVHDVVDGSAYPAKLASLNLDLALAPLGDTPSNRGKSHLRLLEYGACGVPVICSDLEPYQEDLPVTRVKNLYEAWVEAIRAHAGDLDGAALIGDALRERVRRDWMLAGSSLVAWRNIWLPD
jgi:glycosyltransferase involved in cell wall biosynthesis